MNFISVEILYKIVSIDCVQLYRISMRVRINFHKFIVARFIMLNLCYANKYME